VTTLGPAVWVVDDDASVRRALDRLLRAAAYRVRVFASAQEFLEQLQSEEPACVVLDVRMPGQSGLDLRETLVGEGRDLPIIFITGHGNIPMAVKAMKTGAVDFLQKPFDEESLLDAVARAVAQDR
jgi:FixJ family two-component response regulator